MKLYELLNIFPFGEEIQIILRDRNHYAIRESMIRRPPFLDEEVKIPEDIFPYLDYQVLEFHPEGKKIAIQIDISAKYHKEYEYATSLTVL